MESAYRSCLLAELADDGIEVRAEVPIPLRYRGRALDCGYRADLIVGEKVLVELKCVDRIIALHEAQVITYLRLSGLKTGLLLNFNTTSLRHGIRRFAN